MSFFRSLVSLVKANRVVRFVLVGALNTTFGYLIYVLCLFVGFSYQLANLFGLIIGILFSFKTQGTLVFKNTDHGLFFRFAICWGVIYLCNIGFIRQMLIFGLDAYSAGALAIAPIAVLSYLLQKYLVFNTKDRPISDL